MLAAAGAAQLEANGHVAASKEPHALSPPMQAYCDLQHGSSQIAYGASYSASDSLGRAACHAAPANSFATSVAAFAALYRYMTSDRRLLTERAAARLELTPRK